MKKIIFVLIFLIFIAGCAKEIKEKTQIQPTLPDETIKIAEEEKSKGLEKPIQEETKQEETQAPVIKEEIKLLQEKIDNLLIQTPQLTSNGLCTLKDFGNEVRLVCPTEGGYGTASGSYYETYNTSGVLRCEGIRVDSLDLLARYKGYNCTFEEYSIIIPIKKPPYITMYNTHQDKSNLFCNITGTDMDSAKEGIKYIAIDIESRKKQVELTVENCLKLRHPEDRNLCFRCIAITNRNVSFCDILVDEGNISVFGSFKPAQESKDECYRVVGPDKGDISICKKIVDIDTKNYCYRDIARNLHNKSICDNIIVQDGREVEECLEYANEELEGKNDS